MNISVLFSRLKKVGAINLIKHFSQLLLGIILARHLSVEDKGLHFIFTSLAAASAILMSFGLVNSIVYHSKKGFIGVKNSLKIFLIAISLTSVITGIVLYFFSAYVFNILLGEREATNQFLIMFYLYIVTSLCGYFVITYSLAFTRIKIYFLFSVVTSIVCSLTIYIGLYLYNLDIYQCLFLIVLFEGGASLTAIYLLFRKVDTQQLEVEKGFRDVFKYALRSYLGVSGSTLISHGDTFILSNTLSQESLGLYSIAKIFYRLFAIIPQLSNSVIFGLLCEIKILEAKALVRKVSLVFLCVSVPVIGLSYFFIDNLIVVIYGHVYSKASVAAFILLTGAALMATSSAINPFLLAFNKPFISSKITLVSGSVGLLFCIFFSFQFGIEGAAMSVLMSSSISCLMRFFSFYKFDK